MTEPFRQYEASIGNINYRSKTTSGFGSLPVLGTDAYTVVDLRAGLQAADKSWQVMAFARNITNKYYWTNVDWPTLFDGSPASREPMVSRISAKF